MRRPLYLKNPLNERKPTAVTYTSEAHHRKRRPPPEAKVLASEAKAPPATPRHCGLEATFVDLHAITARSPSTWQSEAKQRQENAACGASWPACDEPEGETKVERISATFLRANGRQREDH